MFLGVSRTRLIVSFLLIVLGLAAFGTGVGETLGRVLGLIALVLGLAVFSATPTKSSHPGPPAETESAAPATAPPPASPPRPRPRPAIEARDSSEV